MKKVTLTINDEEVEAWEGMTLLEAARSIGIDIPTLCHHEKLAPYGGCRLCTVEITRQRWTRLVASCVYPVEDGLIVKTESDPVVKGRRMILELLWARAPGIQALRNYGTKYGVTGVQPVSPYHLGTLKTKFEIEPTFCILCGLCVRYCAEVIKKNAIGFVSRGTAREVMFLPEVALKECPKCKQCFPLCPTGILQPLFELTQRNMSLRGS